MNLNELFSKAQFDFVVPSFPGEETVTGFELLPPLLESLLELQTNSATPQRLIEEAHTAHFSLSSTLKQVWIKSFADDRETLPKEVAFELKQPGSMPDFGQPMRYRQLNALANLRYLIETGEATDANIETHDLIAHALNSPSHTPEGYEIQFPEQIAQYAFALIREAFEMEAVYVAIHLVLSKRNEADASTTTEKIFRLYPNSKTIDISRQMGLSKPIADSLFKTIRNANRQDAIAQFQKSGTRDTTFRTANKGKRTDTEFVFDKEKLAIRTAEQFADQLMKVRDAKVLQTFFALIKWSNLNDSWAFREVPISEIMGLVLKSSADNKFNTKHRREFSEVLEYLTSISITISIIGDQVNTRTGKSKPALQEEKGVKLFRMMATYSVKKEFQHIPKESLIPDIHFDKSVITRFSAELFPGNSSLFKHRASVYSDSLLTMDANKDNKAILLGYQFETRFNQLGDKDKCIEYDRKGLIDLCDYAKTDKTKPSQATKQLANNLDKLKKHGIISKYTGLPTNVDTDVIKIYPPTPTKLAATK